MPPAQPLRPEDRQTVRQYSGSLAMLYRLYTWKRLTARVGIEGQYLYAKAPVPVGISQREMNDRLSAGVLTGVSLRPSHWLSIIGEVGLGYLRGMPTNSSASFDLRGHVYL